MILYLCLLSAKIMGVCLLIKVKRYTKMLDSAPHLGFLFFKNYYYCVHECVVGTPILWLSVELRDNSLWSWFLQFCVAPGDQTQAARLAQPVLHLLSHLASPLTVPFNSKMFMIGNTFISKWGRSLHF